MPDLLNRSADDMLAAMAAAFGARWPNVWWPRGTSAYDDCAACVSYYLFGLNSLGNPFYSYVSQIQNWGKSIGAWHAGHAGVQRGDVLAFDWDGDGDPDHTEVVVAVSSGGSIVTSRGTNSNPGDDMRDRSRSASYILSYVRPPYPGTTSAGTGGAVTIQPTTPSAPAISPLLEDDMPYILSSSLGQTLISGDHAVGFATPAEVQTTSGSGVPTVAVSPRMHTALLGALNLKTGLPIVVSVTGDPTIYALAGDELVPLSEKTTVQGLQNQGAPQITIAPAERDRLLQKQ